MQWSPPMPVARIYASLVEEAEPICADLLARGYNVEVVFPDAILPNPADLELRVERCSAEQAIARVEAGGSPSRCVFVTPAKGPRRELLLVEMTVLGTGTDGRHPMAMPIPMPIPEIALAAEVPAGISVESVLAAVLPFPFAPQPTPDALSLERLVAGNGVGVPQTERSASLLRENGENLGKNVIAELNAFLAHAPIVERPETLPVKIFQTVRSSRGVERARKNWEGLTLLGVAVSFLLLLSLGWYAAPDLPRRVVTSTADSATPPATGAVQPLSVTPAAVAEVDLSSIVLESRTSSVSVRLGKLHRARSVATRRQQPLQDDFIAQDRVVRSAQGLPSKLSQSRTTSELIQPAAIRSAPIKKITDLK